MTGLWLPLCLLIVLTYCEDKGFENNPGEYLIRFSWKKADMLFQCHSYACHGFRHVKDLLFETSVFYLQKERGGKGSWNLPQPSNSRGSSGLTPDQSKPAKMALVTALILKSDGSRSLCVWVTLPSHEVLWVKPEWVLSCGQINSNL